MNNPTTVRKRTPAKMLLTCGFLLAGIFVISGCTSATQAPQPTQPPLSIQSPMPVSSSDRYTGTWKGMTDQGDDISFVVKGTQITEFSASYKLDKTCSSSVKPISLRGIIIDPTTNGFTDSDLDTDAVRLEGYFTSDTATTGKLDILPTQLGCDRKLIHWDAKKQ